MSLRILLATGQVREVRSDSCEIVREDELPVALSGRCLSAPPGAGTLAPRDDVEFPWLWWPWGRERKGKVESRRYGHYRLDTEFGLLLVRVDPSRILNRAAYVGMLQDLQASLPTAIWDEPDEIRVHAKTRATGARASIETLLLDVERNLPALVEVARRPAAEVAPPRLGWRRDGPQNRTGDLDENRVALDWSHRRVTGLADAVTVLRDAEHAIQREVESAGEPVPPWGRAMMKGAADIERKADHIDALSARIRRVAEPLRTICSSRRWSTQPSITRRVAPSRLARSLSRDHVGFGIPADLSVLSPRTVSFLFEAWAAIKVARLLKRIGFVQRSGPDVLDSWAGTGIALPSRIRWVFGRGDVSIRWVYGPRARVLPVRQVPIGRSRREACHMAAMQQGLRNCLITPSNKSTPDYTLYVVRGDREVWVVGDATFSDPNYTGGVKAKITTLRNYARDLLWIDGRGTGVPCTAAGSFAVVPGRSADWLSDQHVREGAAPLGIVLLPMPPGDSLDDAYDVLGQVVAAMIERLGPSVQ